MKYALLIYEAPGSLEALPKGQYEAMFAEYMALSQRCTASSRRSRARQWSS